MNADVEKAVAWIDSYHGALPQVVRGDWAIIKQALRDQEAEIARLQNITDGNAELYQHELLRAERVDALLRSCKAACQRVIEDGGGIFAGIDFNALNSAITAHLGAKHE